MKHDTTLRRHPSVIPKGNGIAIGALHPAYRYGRTIFSSRVFDADEVDRVLKDGGQNRKIGREVRKGPRRGWPIYMLTLEERATCPRTCEAWSFCYGNRSQAAERIVAGPELEAKLWIELEKLQDKHPKGFLIRLHILGDFYSLEYVKLWQRALETFHALHIFGFTARNPATDPIGAELATMIEHGWNRFAIRFSGAKGPRRASRLLGQEKDPEAITCPAQSDKTDCCATCALCWQSDRSIAFMKH